MLNNNGSALTKKRAQQILDSGLTRLRFSLDAFNNETYSKVRVGSISLDRVKRNIFNFLELKEKGGYKLPIVGVSFCVLKQNENEVDDFKIIERYCRYSIYSKICTTNIKQRKI